MEASFSFTVIRSLYSSNPGQAIPSAFGHYDSAVTEVSQTRRKINNFMKPKVANTAEKVCPDCNHVIEVIKGYVTWCEKCNWNLQTVKKYVPN
jgi:hypothetical protein